MEISLHNFASECSQESLTQSLFYITGCSPQPVCADLAGAGLGLLPGVLSQPGAPADAPPPLLRALPARPQGRLQGVSRLIFYTSWGLLGY